MIGKYLLGCDLAIIFVFMYKIVNTEEYAQMRGITQQAVRKAIVKGHNLPGVIEILDKTGKYWLLKVAVNHVPNKKKGK